MIGGLPEKLKDLRIKYGYSQRRVAKILNLSPSIVSSYENGDRTPSTDVLLALANLYRCSTDYLLGKDKKLQKTLDVEGLTDEQIDVLQSLVDIMKK